MKVKILKNSDDLLHQDQVKSVEAIKLIVYDKDNVRYAIEFEGLWGGMEEWITIHADRVILIRPEASNMIRIRMLRLGIP